MPTPFDPPEPASIPGSGHSYDARDRQVDQTERISTRVPSSPTRPSWWSTTCSPPLPAEVSKIPGVLGVALSPAMIAIPKVGFANRFPVAAFSKTPRREMLLPDTGRQHLCRANLDTTPDPHKCTATGTVVQGQGREPGPDIQRRVPGTRNLNKDLTDAGDHLQGDPAYCHRCRRHACADGGMVRGDGPRIFSVCSVSGDSPTRIMVRWR